MVSKPARNRLRARRIIQFIDRLIVPSGLGAGDPLRLTVSTGILVGGVRMGGRLWGRRAVQHFSRDHTARIRGRGEGQSGHRQSEDHAPRGLHDGPAGIGTFATAAPIDPVAAVVRTGVQLYTGRLLDFPLQHDGAYSGITTTHAGSLVASLRF